MRLMRSASQPERLEDDNFGIIRCLIVDIILKGVHEGRDVLL